MSLLKEVDLDNLIALESAFDVFDENMPHISSLNNWLLGINGSFLIILINIIPDLKKVFSTVLYSKIIFFIFFLAIFALLFFIVFQRFIKYLIFRIRIKATPIKIALNSHVIDGKRLFKKYNKILKENLEDINSELVKKEVSELELFLDNSKIIANQLESLTSRRDSLLKYLNKSIILSKVLGITLGILFGLYLYFSIMK